MGADINIAQIAGKEVNMSYGGFRWKRKAQNMLWKSIFGK